MEVWQGLREDMPESWLEIKPSHDALICNGPFQPSILPAVWRALVMISPKLKSYAALE